MKYIVYHLKTRKNYLYLWIQVNIDLLKKIDEVAYVRFASVYQQSADVESFFNELKKLMGDRKK